jgi:peroxisomal 2,4-dienoyl-CoA reductase
VPDLIKGKVAFVTGGGSGIGFTICEILMRHGCDTAIASRNMERLQIAKEKLEKATGRRCLAIQMDVRKPETVMAAVDQILGQYGKIDILVNNAAGNFLAPMASLSYNAFKTVIEIDTIGTFNVSKTVFEKYMKGHGGAIINISAVLHQRGNLLQAHAGAAKAAIDALTNHMAVEWGPNRIRVVGIAPGPIGDTEGFRRLGGGVAGRDADDFFAKMVPVGRMGRKDEIAHLLLYLVSDLGEYISGETIKVDGGFWMVPPNDLDTLAQKMARIKAQSKM